jgi:hypothetical protein
MNSLDVGTRTGTPHTRCAMRKSTHPASPCPSSIVIHRQSLSECRQQRLVSFSSRKTCTTRFWVCAACMEAARHGPRSIVNHQHNNNRLRSRSKTSQSALGPPGPPPATLPPCLHQPPSHLHTLPRMPGACEPRPAPPGPRHPPLLALLRVRARRTHDPKQRPQIRGARSTHMPCGSRASSQS